MALSATIDIPTFGEPLSLEAKAGGSVVFIGANGAGKTRLGAFLDAQLSQAGTEVHRIAAHRSLNLNPEVVPTNFQIATNRLHYGYEAGGFFYKLSRRFGGKPETAMLDDFDHLLSALYAENNDVSIAFREKCLANPSVHQTPTPTKMDRLKAIWETVLPHRRLVVLGGQVKTSTTDGHEYSASEMSDGERVIFYVIGQMLLAKADTLLIFDEPELHINKAILAKLWDEIESARPDCGFLYITHDVEFASSRHATTKYALRTYRKEPNEAWDIELVPDGAEIPDDVVATIIGSRRPVLFVEGDGGSLDSSLYRRVYHDFTVIPVGSCERVIHTVSSFAGRPELHHVGCAGLVDADGRNPTEKAYLETKGVYSLAVSEVENLLLLPNVFKAIAKALKFEDADVELKFGALCTYVFAQASQEIDAICLRYTKRRIDVNMKKIGLAATNLADLDAEFRTAAASIDAPAIFAEAKTTLTTAINERDYEKVLYHYDNKGLFAEAAKLLGYQQKALEEFIGRALRSDDSPELHTALSGYLPTVTPRP